MEGRSKGGFNSCNFEPEQNILVKPMLCDDDERKFISRSTASNFSDLNNSYSPSFLYYILS